MGGQACWLHVPGATLTLLLMIKHALRARNIHTHRRCSADSRHLALPFHAAVAATGPVPVQGHRALQHPHILKHTLCTANSCKSPPLHPLPSLLAVQDPFLFKGTVRRNLDPLGEHKEEALWRALEQVWEEVWGRGKVAWEGRIDAL